MHTRPAKEADIAWLGTLLAADYVSAAFGYPRCESADVLLAELAVYGLDLSLAMSIVEKEGEAVAAFGFLYDPAENGADAYLVGPLPPAGNDPTRFRELIALVSTQARRRRLRAVRSCIAVGDRLAQERLAAEGWRVARRDLEMRLPIPVRRHACPGYGRAARSYPSLVRRGSRSAWRCVPISPAGLRASRALL